MMDMTFTFRPGGAPQMTPSGARIITIQAATKSVDVDIEWLYRLVLSEYLSAPSATPTLQQYSDACQRWSEAQPRIQTDYITGRITARYGARFHPDTDVTPITNALRQMCAAKQAPVPGPLWVASILLLNSTPPRTIDIDVGWIATAIKTEFKDCGLWRRLTEAQQFEYVKKKVLARYDANFTDPTSLSLATKRVGSLCDLAFEELQMGGSAPPHNQQAQQHNQHPPTQNQQAQPNNQWPPPHQHPPIFQPPRLPFPAPQPTQNRMNPSQRSAVVIALLITAGLAYWIGSQSK